ncbi:hypothetical protein JIQ42_02836 [Leishmania sp. Namibia]|uniref:hypothetical protein n=1 Tax=Leishmania sp. Namibia TaxID=2802991 RepID=UPI001B6BCFF2|nr:hypothetical protein JIQ42_02836 [Leishmania sp. Namibia]
MPAPGKSRPCKRFGTFGDPDRELTQAEREFYASLERIRKKRRPAKEFLSAERQRQEDAEQRSNRNGLLGKKSGSERFSLGRHPVTSAAAAPGTALPVPCSLPRDNRLAVLSALELPDRTPPPVWEPNRHEARARSASEGRSDCVQRAPERRRGFGFTDRRAAKGGCRPGDSILLPSRYLSAPLSKESTPSRQRTRRAPETPVASASKSPKRAARVPLRIRLLQKLSLIKALNAPRASPHQCPKRGTSNLSSITGGGASRNVSRFTDLSDDDMSVTDRISRALDAFHREYSSSGSFILRGLTDEQAETLEELLEKRRRRRSEAAAANTSASTSPTQHHLNADAAVAHRLAFQEEQQEMLMNAGPTMKREAKQVTATEKQAPAGCFHRALASVPKATAAAGEASPAGPVMLVPLTKSTLKAVAAVTATAATATARTSLPLSRAEMVRAAVSHPPTRPPPTLHAHHVVRHVSRASRETSEPASRQRHGCVFRGRQGGSRSCGRRVGLLGSFPCISRQAAQAGLAEKRCMRAAQDPLRKEARTKARALSNAALIEEVCRQYREQCRRHEREMTKSVERERRSARAAWRKADCSSSTSTALRGTATSAGSAVGSCCSRTEAAATAGASAGQRESRRSTSADRTALRRSADIRSAQWMPLSSADLNRASTSESGRKRGGARLPMLPHSFVARIEGDVDNMPNERTPSAHGSVVCAGAGAGGVSSTPMGVSDGSQNRSFSLRLQEPNNASSLTAALLYEPSSIEASRTSPRTSSIMDTSSAVNHCSTASSVSPAEETVETIMMAYHKAGSSRPRQLHENTGERGDPTRQWVDLLGFATESHSSQPTRQRESQQCVLAGVPVHTASSGGTGNRTTGDDASDTVNDFYVSSAPIECRSDSPQRQQTARKTPTSLSLTDTPPMPFYAFTS